MSEPMTDEQIAAMAEALRDPDAALALLPAKDQREYHEAMQSVIDARRAGERIARELWIG